MIRLGLSSGSNGILEREYFQAASDLPPGSPQTAYPTPYILDEAPLPLLISPCIATSLIRIASHQAATPHHRTSPSPLRIAKSSGTVLLRSGKSPRPRGEKRDLYFLYSHSDKQATFSPQKVSLLYAQSTQGGRYHPQHRRKFPTK